MSPAAAPAKITAAPAAVPSKGVAWPPQFETHPERVEWQQRLDAKLRAHADAGVRLKRKRDEVDACDSPLASAVARILGATTGIDLPTTKARLEKEYAAIARELDTLTAELNTLRTATAEDVNARVRHDIRQTLRPIITNAFDDITGALDVIARACETLDRVKGYKLIEMHHASAMALEFAKLVRLEMAKVRVSEGR